MQKANIYISCNTRLKLKKSNQRVQINNEKKAKEENTGSLTLLISTYVSMYVHSTTLTSAEVQASANLDLTIWFPRPATVVDG